MAKSREQRAEERIRAILREKLLLTRASLFISNRTVRHDPEADLLARRLWERSGDSDRQLKKARAQYPEISSDRVIALENEEFQKLVPAIASRSGQNQRDQTMPNKTLEDFAEEHIRSIIAAILLSTDCAVYLSGVAEQTEEIRALTQRFAGSIENQHRQLKEALEQYPHITPERVAEIEREEADKLQKPLSVQPITGEPVADHRADCR